MTCIHHTTNTKETPIVSCLPHRYRYDPKLFTNQYTFTQRESLSLLMAKKRIGNYASAEMIEVHSYSLCIATCSYGTTTTTGLVLLLEAVKPNTTISPCTAPRSHGSKLPLVLALLLAAVEPGTLQCSLDTAARKFIYLEKECTRSSQTRKDKSVLVSDGKATKLITSQ
ncbi:12677_t:CDS:2 [Dentiscutata heterogama]|uniref:12677_t:CDS:1 n=1 Tax=Dentiscutata heterogama TaxID=1316150 RepID=A0ACA9N3V3_9GLOM|nr:12677_t:CDS:2 [Dentiscutata heterogama]